MANRKPDHEPDRDEDEVTEAGYESFPASDPPAFNQSGTRLDPVETIGGDEREQGRPAREAGRADGTTGAADAEQGRREAAAEPERRIADVERHDRPAPAPDPVRHGVGTGRLVVNTAIAVLVVAILVWLIFG